MAIANEFELIIAAVDADGKSYFAEAGEPAALEVPGAIDGAFVWETDGIVSLPLQIGGAPSGMTFPGPGGSKLGLFRFPAHSAGKLDMAAAGTKDAETGVGGEADMHRTDTIDYEIILSGKVDIELPGGQVRTLKPGSVLIMAGAPHAWRNHYDEDCTYVAVVVGAHPPVS
ncbi:cupin domain-containing protein [Rhodococcus sp. 14C212]|uniref:cupin domain-containing protein n=1 Tax=Rhodococcus sp. 14C212 TaxID=2711209 RepID=UPI0013E9FF4E|nr:cupin domain-containing protein [Rhodococcus sp. 14C212]NGP09465.1 cupin domain-containing protein [Rhodococcus sp. 14C212]